MKIRLNEANWAVPVETAQQLDNLFGGAVEVEVWEWDPETGSHHRLVRGLTSPLAGMYECWARARHATQHHPDCIDLSGMAAVLRPLPGSDAGSRGGYYCTLRFPPAPETETDDFVVV